MRDRGPCAPLPTSLYRDLSLWTVLPSFVCRFFLPTEIVGNSETFLRIIEYLNCFFVAKMGILISYLIGISRPKFIDSGSSFDISSIFPICSFSSTTFRTS